MIRIGFRRRSLLRWVGYHFIADPTLPNVFRSTEDEKRVVASIQNTIDSTLGEQKAVPKWAPKDIRLALQTTNPARRPVLQAAARRLIKAIVVREAIRIASGRASYRWHGRVGISASILAGAIVTVTPFINCYRSEVTPPDCAPSRPRNRHARRKGSATATRSVSMQEPKPTGGRHANIKRLPPTRGG